MIRIDKPTVRVHRHRGSLRQGMRLTFEMLLPPETHLLDLAGLSGHHQFAGTLEVARAEDDHSTPVIRSPEVVAICMDSVWRHARDFGASLGFNLGLDQFQIAIDQPALLAATA